jgi:hypothetical protein
MRPVYIEIRKWAGFGLKFSVQQYLPHFSNIISTLLKYYFFSQKIISNVSFQKNQKIAPQYVQIAGPSEIVFSFLIPNS